MNLTSPLSELRGVGPARSRELAELGLTTVGDLLQVLPIGYEDRRHVMSLADVEDEGPALFRVHLTGLRMLRTRKRNLTMVRGQARDETGKMTAIWFNRPYLANQIDPQKLYLVHGKVRRGKGGWELLNADVAPLESGGEGRILPVYRALGSMGPKMVRGYIAQILDGLPDPLPIEDPLPAELLAKYDLPDLATSLRAMHDPVSTASPGSLSEGRRKYRDRMAYGELLELQLVLARARAGRSARTKPHGYRVDDGVRQAARTMLPFSLTKAQKRALGEIVQDLRNSKPMGRLLQGDVGSGKTIVAALALLIAAESGLQAALMAPTELLAEQQFATLRGWMGERCRVGLLTGSSKDAETTMQALAEGSLAVVVGTHALIQDAVRFRKLALVIVDEQHRFGVAQRQALCRKGPCPDLLVMTATPIPRSLAMTVWGDLDRSVIDELPPGRSPVKTEVVGKRARAGLYRRAREAIGEGQRIFVVLPRIESEEGSEVASIEKEGEQIRGWLQPHSAAIAHGRLSPTERARALDDFVSGKVGALIATTVVEVGIDVPEATWMVIESAERFGLAQLHQLRGRVGRGVKSSRCIAVEGKTTSEGSARLEAFQGSTDGFQLAEQDLALRGPGDLLGLRQAGTPLLETAELVRDRQWLERAHEDAAALLPRLTDPGLASLRVSVERKAERWKALRASERES